eukprot:scaffold3360_cov112-Isochrysis_galbana.AAC.9
MVLSSKIRCAGPMPMGRRGVVRGHARQRSAAAPENVGCDGGRSTSTPGTRDLGGRGTTWSASPMRVRASCVYTCNTKQATSCSSPNPMARTKFLRNTSLCAAPLCRQRLKERAQSALEAVSIGEYGELEHCPVHLPYRHQAALVVTQRGEPLRPFFHEPVGRYNVQHGELVLDGADLVIVVPDAVRAVVRY